MTPEQLMQPRVKCIGVGDFHYPESPFHVGQIIIANQVGWPESIKHFEKYPHLFEVLPWYAERAEGDMPEYVKFGDERLSITSYGNDIEPEIHKVKKHFRNSLNSGMRYSDKDSFISEWHNTQYCYGSFLPATLDEYNTYNQSQK